VRIGVLGTGNVGRTIAAKLVALGHDVRVGSRTAKDDAVTFADAAAHGELVFNCTAGDASLAALRMAVEENLADKILVDVANPLDFSQGMPPILAVCNADSLGEEIQRSFPRSKVVKTLNTVNCNVMVDPSIVPGEHDVFVCGNDEGAKDEVRELLESFGWPSERINDLGDITAARGTEMYLPLWLRLMGVTGGANFNIRVVR
jgi:8-hydroxy-5-deazaflavin:NADPH oxidoreductase